MSAKNTQESRAEKNFENIGEALSTSEQFLEKNQKSIVIGLIIIIAVVGAFLAYTECHAPKKHKRLSSEANATSKMATTHWLSSEMATITSVLNQSSTNTRAPKLPTLHMLMQVYPTAVWATTRKH